MYEQGNQLPQYPQSPNSGFGTSQHPNHSATFSYPTQDIGFAMPPSLPGTPSEHFQANRTAPIGGNASFSMGDQKSLPYPQPPPPNDDSLQGIHSFNQV